MATGQQSEHVQLQRIVVLCPVFEVVVPAQQGRIDRIAKHHRAKVPLFGLLWRADYDQLRAPPDGHFSANELTDILVPMVVPSR